jgi:hypothetical protein
VLITYIEVLQTGPTIRTIISLNGIFIISEEIEGGPGDRGEGAAL